MQKAVLCAMSAATLLAAGCSGSNEQRASGTHPKPTSTSSKRSVPPRIPKGTIHVTPLRSPPPAERLPRFRAVKLASANYPAGLAAAPDGRVFYSELWTGRIRVIRRDGSVDPVPWADVNAKYGIQWKTFFHGGLTGIAFDPAFARNHFVYAVTQVPSKRTGLSGKSLIVRFKEMKGRGTSPRVLLTLPASKFDNTYSLVFGPDGMLYIPSGYLTSGRPPRGDPLRDLKGEILRVTPVGKAPGDNPYGARAPRVWATGFKNAFDLAFFPHSGVATTSDNGTSEHDELDLLMPGNDYGYPKREGFTRVPSLTPPMLDYGSDRESPVGIIYYDGRRYPALRGRFLMCHNHGQGMVALRINRSNPGRLLRMTPILPECTLDLVQMPDGSVVFSDAQAIYRLVPA